MSLALEPWLDRFSAGAGAQYVWHLAPGGRIRATLAPDYTTCPLAGEATYEDGVLREVGEWYRAGRQQGLTEEECVTLTAAADSPSVAQRLGLDVEAIRERLLRICRLEEVEG